MSKKFDSQYDRIGKRETLYPGDMMKKTYKMHVDDDGKRTLKPNGEINHYMEIQSHKDSCSIATLMARFVNGDETALSRVQGIYGDFTQMPTTLAELQQRVIDAEHLFNNLPLDIRAQYNHSASEFFAQLDSERTTNIFKNDERFKEFFPQPDVVTPVEPTPSVQVKEVQANA